jgi:hypothetical protein
MTLLLLPDVCELPNTAPKKQKRHREPEPLRVVEVAHSESTTSLSSGSSALSKASATSSQCSFAPIKRTASAPGGRVRIAIGGNVNRL